MQVRLTKPPHLAMLAVRLGVRVAGWIPRALHVDKLRAWTRGRELPQPQGPPFRNPQKGGRSTFSQEDRR